MNNLFKNSYSVEQYATRARNIYSIVPEPGMSISFRYMHGRMKFVPIFVFKRRRKIQCKMLTVHEF
jgi:hypothetical protein